MTRNNQGFTLMEMLMVVFIIATLLILTIPNITKHKQNVEETSCQAYADLVQTQVVAYMLAENQTPTIEQLEANGYIASKTCSDGTSLSIDGDGQVAIEQ